MLNLTNKIWCIFGLNGTGKSHLAKFIAKNYNAVFFDVLNEHSKEFDSYVPKNKNYPEIATEFDYFLTKIQSHKYNMIIVDEASRVFPNMRPLQPVMRSYIDTFRHTHQSSIGFICRRPTQLFTDLVELSHYLFIFKMVGKNDIQYLNFISVGLGDTVSQLEKYHFVVVNEDRTFNICKPI